MTDGVEQEEIIEDANDLLAEALHDANVYCGHEEVRPSALRAFDKMQEAHNLLEEIDPSRSVSSETAQEEQ